MIITQEWLHIFIAIISMINSQRKSYLDRSTDTLKMYVKDGKSRLHQPNHSIACQCEGVYASMQPPKKDQQKYLQLMLSV